MSAALPGAGASGSTVVRRSDPLPWSFHWHAYRKARRQVMR